MNPILEEISKVDFFDEIDIYYHALNELNILIENNLINETIPLVNKHLKEIFDADDIVVHFFARQI